MASTKISKSKLLQISQDLLKRYGPGKPREYLDFVEVLVYQILEVGTTDRAAKDALKRIGEEYVDWNEMRVATVREIQDILGPRYDHCRQRAEDLHSLLADLYTAFRKMELNDVICTPEGLETLRALPDTTLIRGDMVERALLIFYQVRTFPCDDEQFEILRFLGGVGKKTEFEDGLEAVTEVLSRDELLDLHRGLREHADFLIKHRMYDPQPVDWTSDKEKKAASTTTETPKTTDTNTAAKPATATKSAKTRSATPKTTKAKTKNKATSTKASPSTIKSTKAKVAKTSAANRPAKKSTDKKTAKKTPAAAKTTAKKKSTINKKR